MQSCRLSETKRDGISAWGSETVHGEGRLFKKSTIMEADDFLKKIPPFTKIYMIGVLIMAACASFSLIGIEYVYLDFE